MVSKYLKYDISDISLLRKGESVNCDFERITMPQLMKVKYISNFKTIALIKGKIYDVISIAKGWYRIMTELDEDYLFPPRHFEIVQE